jgi:ankyrin repeat protein
MAQAIANDDMAAIEAILAIGKSADTGGHDGCTPLMLACGGMFVKRVIASSEAFEKDPALTKDKWKEKWQKEERESTQIPEREEIVRRLLAAGADPNAKHSSYKFSALHCCALVGHCKSMQLLLQHGADVDAVDKDNGTALFNATVFNKIQATKILLKANAQVNHCSNDGFIALSSIAVLDCAELVEILLTAGADPTIKDDTGATALHYAAIFGATDTIQELLKAKVDLNVRNNDGYTPVLYAALNSNYRSVQILLDGGADVDSLDKDNRTAIMNAIKSGNHAIAQLLIQKGCALNIRDIHGFTPLMYAISSGHIHIADLILSSHRNVDIDALNSSGDTALSCAKARGYSNIEEKIVAYGAMASLNHQTMPVANSAPQGNGQEILTSGLKTASTILSIGQAFDALSS